MTAHRAYRIAALLVLAATSAAAEPPRIGVLAGLGARQEWGPGPALITYHPDGPGPRPALHATVTIAFSPHLAFGAHAAATKATYRDVLRDCYTLISTDLAIALAYVYPRFTVAPWLGRHLSRVNSIGDYACEPHAPLRAYWA
ncbi:MAG TPA: hypothetical protein VN253_20665, partial [Kofleriaceae bacterium]|nr:hypothetical protein [Kofleriaceae bacterium]